MMFACGGLMLREAHRLVVRLLNPVASGLQHDQLTAFTSGPGREVSVLDM